MTLLLTLLQMMVALLMIVLHATRTFAYDDPATHTLADNDPTAHKLVDDDPLRHQCQR